MVRTTKKMPAMSPDLRFNDLELAVLLAPFANINFFFLGDKWYSVLIVRLIFYAITFASAVIAGMRFVCAVSCFYCCACACNTEAIKVRTYKHLFAGIGFQLLSIFLKLMTTSSAFSTYLLLGIQLNYSLRLAYLVFTVLRGVSSLFSLGFTAALLRWTVLKTLSSRAWWGLGMRLICMGTANVLADYSLAVQYQEIGVACIRSMHTHWYTCTCRGFSA